MSRPTDSRVAVCVLMVAGVLAPARVAAPYAAPAQTPALEQADDVVEAYLQQRGLRQLLVVQLRQRLESATGPDRLELAERLGGLYVTLLSDAATAAERERWEEESRTLLRDYPEAESYELRINLAKARYLAAEEITERARLRLASPEEESEAERILRSVGPVLEDLATRVHRRVEQLERFESRASDDQLPEVQAELAEMRRLRSLANYYAAWSKLYIAELTGADRYAGDAMEDFGWLLNALPGRAATLQRAPRRLFYLEHVARSAMGCALCESLRGNHERALAWLDAVEQAQDVAPAVRDQLFARRVTVLARAKRWADLELAVRRRRQAEGGGIRPLTVGEARVLVVLMLEQLDAGGERTLRGDLLEQIAQSGLADLVTQGEVGHVLDLVERYGTAPIGNEGFIVLYVRGLQSHRRAQEAHKATGEPLDEPTHDTAVANAYTEAAKLLRAACESPDAATFPDQRTDARLMVGMSLLTAGDPERAADEFEKAYQQGSGGHVEEALWLAIGALNRAVTDGRRGLASRRDRLAALYLQQYPNTERAARLLLVQATSGLLDPREAVTVLLNVTPESPLYETARRHAATLLYRLYRLLPPGSADRDYAAIRFVDVAEEVLAIDRRLAIDGSAQEAADLTDRVVRRVRQMLDALLGMSAADLDRAERALELLDEIALHAGIDLEPLADELAYRRLQIAAGCGDERAIAALATELHRLGGRYADAADRLLYMRAVSAWSEDEEDPASAEAVVRYGTPVLARLGSDPTSLADPAVASAHAAVARAAAVLWRARGSPDDRDLAIRIDRMLIAAGHQSDDVLRRHAELTEAAGDQAAALDCWRLLMAGAEADSPAWFESRYHSLRLLAQAEPARAAVVMRQHRLLYPDLGPGEWSAKFAELERTIAAGSGDGSGGP